MTPCGNMYAIEFEDGSLTQGNSRDDVLVMAADLRACMDDKHPSRYVARWTGEETIAITVVG